MPPPDADESEPLIPNDQSPGDVSEPPLTAGSGPKADASAPLNGSVTPVKVRTELSSLMPFMVGFGVLAFLHLTKLVTESTKAQKTAAEVPELLREILVELRNLREAMDTGGQA